MNRTYPWVSSACGTLRSRCLRFLLQSYSILFALIGLSISPLAVAHASPSPDPVATLQFDEVSSMSFSPDGTLLAIGGEDGLLQLWDVASKQQVATLQAEFWIHSLSFSPDGSTLASIGGQWLVQLWDVASRQEIATHISHSPFGPQKLSFSPDGTLLAIGGLEWNPDTKEWIGDVQLWDTARRQQEVNFSVLGGVSSMSFSPDGTLLAIGGEGSAVRLWDVASKQQVATLQVGTDVAVRSMSFSPDGTLLAIGGLEWSPDPESLLQLWDVGSRQQVAALVSRMWSPTVSFSPDGSTLASAGGDFTGDTVKLWDVATRQEIASFSVATEEHEIFEVPVSFSPDGTLLATIGNDETVRLWDVSEWVGEQTITDEEEADGEEDGELDDFESSGEDQPETAGQPTTAVELKGIAASHDSIREDGTATTITVTVTLDRAAATDETITLAIVSPLVGKPAQRGEDFDATFPEIFTIAKGQRTGTAQLILTPKDNATADGDKAFAVQATSSSGHAALINIKIIGNDSADEPQARLMPNPSEVEFSADDPAWKTFTVHTSLDSVLVRANPSGSDPAIEVSGGQQVPTRDFCPAEGNDRPSSGRRDGWNLHVKACQAGQTKILLIDYDTGEVVQQYEVNVEGAGSSALTALNPSYPNPFNSETVLSYTLPTASAIRLEVFTLSGQRVAVLHEGFQAAGYHTVAMDASDLASGVYLYRLSTPEGRFVQKFTLLR